MQHQASAYGDTIASFGKPWKYLLTGYPERLVSLSSAASIVIAVVNCLVTEPIWKMEFLSCTTPLATLR